MDKSKIDHLFNRLSHRYDFICPFFSFGIDLWWRKKIMDRLPTDRPIDYLDIACGTGALVRQAVKRLQGKTTGLDFSIQMLDVAKNKTPPTVTLIHGDGQAMSFSDNSFDYTTNAFGLRNFPDPQLGLKENYRVLKTEGQALFLELSLPKNPMVAAFYRFYLHHIIPFLGQFIVKDRMSWIYLGASIEHFSRTFNFLEEMKKAGFTAVSSTPLTFGIARIYQGIKK